MTAVIKYVRDMAQHMIDNKLFLGLTVVYFIFKYYNQQQARKRAEAPVEGSKVHSIKSAEEFDERMEQCKGKGTVIVVDFYATWCPPCLAAAPIYAKMSKGLSFL
jgi:thiol-disulfide isomerase/thioredoxin